MFESLTISNPFQSPVEKALFYVFFALAYLPSLFYVALATSLSGFDEPSAYHPGPAPSN